jgi:hypothetical protein
MNVEQNLLLLKLVFDAVDGVDHLLETIICNTLL